ACSKPRPDGAGFRTRPPPHWGENRCLGCITLSSRKVARRGLSTETSPITDITVAAPNIVRAGSLRDSIHVEPLTCAIGAELSNVDLGVASREPALVAEIRSLLLRHRVLFFRDQDFTRAEHVAFARHFGELEDHPVLGSDPENPGLVRIYKSPETPNDRYENSWHTDATWRAKPPFGCVLRCVECPPVGGDTMWANMALA